MSRFINACVLSILMTAAACGDDGGSEALGGGETDAHVGSEDVGAEDTADSSDEVSGADIVARV